MKYFQVLPLALILILLGACKKEASLAEAPRPPRIAAGSTLSLSSRQARADGSTWFVADRQVEADGSTWSVPVHQSEADDSPWSG